MDDFTLLPRDQFGEMNSEIGAAVLTSAQPIAIVSVAPFKGQLFAVEEALLAMLDIRLPEAGSVANARGAKVLWSGRDQWLVSGDITSEGIATALQGIAAVTDQSDAWVTFCIAGEDAADVMARLCSLDVKRMEQGQTARAEFAHMMSVITPVENGFEIMVMRSLATTAVHHTKEVMKKLAAQRNL